MSNPTLEPQEDKLERIRGYFRGELLVLRETLLRMAGLAHQNVEVDNINRQLERELTSFMVENPKTIARALNLMLVARFFERAADHAKNISELVFYLYTGKDIRHEAELSKNA